MGLKKEVFPKLWATLYILHIYSICQITSKCAKGRKYQYWLPCLMIDPNGIFFGCFVNLQQMYFTGFLECLMKVKVGVTYCCGGNIRTRSIRFYNSAPRLITLVNLLFFSFINIKSQGRAASFSPCIYVYMCRLSILLILDILRQRMIIFLLSFGTLWKVVAKKVKATLFL